MTKEEIFEKLKPILADKLYIQEIEINTGSSFNDLGADSLDQVEVLMSIETEFNIAITDHEMEKVRTVQDVIDLISNKIIQNLQIG